MIRKISLFLVNTILSYFLSDIAFSQNIREVEIRNHNYFSSTNQVIEIKYTSKTRDNANSITRRYLLNLESLNKGSLNLNYVENNSKLYFKFVNNDLYFKHPDSINYILFEPINKKRKPPSNVFFLKYLPLSCTSFFLKNSFESEDSNFQTCAGDTFILEQVSKKLEVVRKLYLDKNLQIFKTEYTSTDSNSLQEKWQYEYKIYKNIELSQLADSLKFGPFNKENFIKNSYINKESTIIYDGKTHVPLTNKKTLILDTTKIKYYIIDLWYIGCKPCSMLRPYLEKIYTNIDTSKAIMLGYNEFDIMEDINTYLKRKNFQIPEIDNSSFYLEQFHTNMHPTVLILDKKFKVIETYVGYSTLNILKIRTFLKAKKLFL